MFSLKLFPISILITEIRRGKSIKILKLKQEFSNLNADFLQKEKRSFKGSHYENLYTLLYHSMNINFRLPNQPGSCI